MFDLHRNRIIQWFDINSPMATECTSFYIMPIYFMIDEEFLTLKKSYEDQKRSEAITSTHPRKTGLYSLTKIQRLPHVITSTTIGSSCFRYRLSSFGRVAQKLHDPVIARW